MFDTSLKSTTYSLPPSVSDCSFFPCNNASSNLCAAAGSYAFHVPLPGDAPSSHSQPMVDARTAALSALASAAAVVASSLSFAVASAADRASSLSFAAASAAAVALETLAAAASLSASASEAAALAADRASSLSFAAASAAAVAQATLRANSSLSLALSRTADHCFI